MAENSIPAKRRMTSYRELIGKRYGRLLVVAYAGSAGGRTRVLCHCDCGAEKVAAARDIIKGSASSCGCFRRELKRQHGKSRTPEHGAWLSIKTRCYNPNRKQWQDYGGRGIRMADVWLNDFPAFLQHIGPRPSPRHTVDRIDNNRGYEPGNVRWATHAEQNRNTRRNALIECRGEAKILADWAATTGIKERTLKARIKHFGWSPERALTTPVRRKAGK